MISQAKCILSCEGKHVDYPATLLPSASHSKTCLEMKTFKDTSPAQLKFSCHSLAICIPHKPTKESIWCRCHMQCIQLHSNLFSTGNTLPILRHFFLVPHHSPVTFWCPEGRMSPSFIHLQSVWSAYRKKAISWHWKKRQFLHATSSANAILLRNFFPVR